MKNKVYKHTALAPSPLEREGGEAPHMQILYAIVASPDFPETLTNRLAEIKGIDGAELVAFSHNGLTAVLGETSRKKVSSTTENVLAYARVIEGLFCDTTVLPLRYGTLMDSEGSVIALLEKYGATFKQNLQQLANKEEFSLKVLWDYDNESIKIRQQMEIAGRNEQPLFSGNSTTKAYLLQKVKGHRFENALLEHAEQLTGDICLLVEQFKPIHQFKKMVSKTMILDAVFLLEKGQKEVFVQAIDQLKNQHKDLSFLLTGPWPPYNFIKLNEKS